MYALGVDIGGTKIAVGIVDGDYKIVAKHSVPTPLIGDTSEERACAIAETISSVAAKLAKENDITTDELSVIGIAAPGAVDPSGEILVSACNLGIRDFPFCKKIREFFNQSRVQMLNDADAAALAELHVGALQGINTGLVLTIGTGIGGGFVLDGKLFRGGNRRGTEIGHVSMDLNGKDCSCGNRGCIETLCSATTLANMAREACNREEGLIYEMAKKGSRVDAKLLINCARAGDEYAVNLFNAYVSSFSNVLAAIVNMLDPQVIAIGGGISEAGEFLLAPLRRLTAEKCFFGSCGSIVKAWAGNDAGILGSVMPL